MHGLRFAIPTNMKNETDQSNLHGLLAEIKELEKAVLEQLKKTESEIVFTVKNRSVMFQKDIAEKHKAFRKSIARFLVETPIMFFAIAPVIYIMIVPAVLMDVSMFFYQMICFPVLGIPKVIRKDYISLDRHKLKYLNWIQKVNCDYCSYFNGVIAFVREIASRSEQYFCPIRHALRTKGLLPRYAQFIPYGDAEAFRNRLAELKKDICEMKS